MPVGGAFWLKTRPKPPLTPGAPSRESTEALFALGVRLHNAENYDGAMEAYRKVLEQVPAHPQAHLQHLLPRARPLSLGQS